jgi:hypothetical protein
MEFLFQFTTICINYINPKSFINFDLSNMN